MPVIPATKSTIDSKNVFIQKNGAKIDLSLLSNLEDVLVEHQDDVISYNLISKLSDVVDKHDGNKIKSGLRFKLENALLKNLGAKVDFKLIDNLNDVVAQHQDEFGVDSNLIDFVTLSDVKIDEVNFDKKPNDKNSILDTNNNFVNQDLNKEGILECDSYFQNVALRIFGSSKGDLFKICGNQIIENVIDDKMSNLLSDPIDKHLYSKLSYNTLDVNKDEIMQILLNKKYRVSYILHFIDEDTADKIKSDKEYSEFIESCSPGIYGSIVVDRGEYIFSYFSDCDVANVLFEKTCNLKAIVNNNSSATYALDNLNCQERIIGNSCMDLDSLKSLSYKDNFRMTNNKYKPNDDVNFDIKLDFANVSMHLIAIFFLALSSIVLFFMIFCSLCKSCKSFMGCDKKKEPSVNNVITQITINNGISGRENNVSGQSNDFGCDERNRSDRGEFLFSNVTSANKGVSVISN